MLKALRRTTAALLLCATALAPALRPMTLT